MRTRYSVPADAEQLIDLARASLAEHHPHATFSENVAWYTFAGAPRFDPAVIVLTDDDEIVGFILGTSRRMPFAEACIMHEDARFIWADKRTLEAESLLLHAFRAFAESVQSSETRLTVPGGHGAVDLFNFVEHMGFRPLGAQMAIDHCAQGHAAAAADTAVQPDAGSSLH